MEVWFALLALAAISLTRADKWPDKCTSQIKGEITENELNWNHFNVDPLIISWGLETPTLYGQCQGQKGLKVTVCDPDGPPAPYMLLERERIFVSRNTKRVRPARVYIAAYCPTSKPKIY